MDPAQREPGVTRALLNRYEFEQEETETAEAQKLGSKWTMPAIRPSGASVPSCETIAPSISTLTYWEWRVAAAILASPPHVHFLPRLEKWPSAW